MSEEHLIRILTSRYAKMAPEKRMVEIRKLARQSVGNREFIKASFPDLYKEAFPNE